MGGWGLDRLPWVLYCIVEEETGALELGCGETEEMVCEQPTWFSGRLGLWVRREYLLELGIGKGRIDGERLEGEDLWDPQ